MALGRETSWCATMKQTPCTLQGVWKFPGFLGRGCPDAKEAGGHKKACGQSGDAPGARRSQNPVRVASQTLGGQMARLKASARARPIWGLQQGEPGTQPVSVKPQEMALTPMHTHTPAQAYAHTLALSCPHRHTHAHSLLYIQELPPHLRGGAGWRGKITGSLSLYPKEEKNHPEEGSPEETRYIYWQISFFLHPPMDPYAHSAICPSIHPTSQPATDWPLCLSHTCPSDAHMEGQGPRLGREGLGRSLKLPLTPV